MSCRLPAAICTHARYHETLPSAACSDLMRTSQLLITLPWLLQDSAKGLPMQQK